MGLEINGLYNLLELKKKENSFNSIAMIGRQCLHVRKNVLINTCKNAGIKVEERECDDLYSDGYSEKLLKHIGFTSIDSVDFSDYEGCTITHDMNKPIPEVYKGKYDVVYDGGSLEHIFNFPVAVKNCLEMVRVGGYFLSVTAGNNYSGHGLYQFSPELFFRICGEINGFEIDMIYIDDNRSRYEVIDPEVVKSRVTFQNLTKTFLVVVAKKVAEKNIFEYTPMQSDYILEWEHGEKTAEKKSNRYMNLAYRCIYKIGKILHIVPKYNKKWFTKITW